MNEIIRKDIREICEDPSLDFSKLQNKKILITGATGMIASYLVYLFKTLNEYNNFNVKIIILVRNKYKAESIFGNRGIEILEQDIEEKIEYKEDIDYIFHLASSANPATIENNPIGIIKANTIGTINVFDLAVEKKSKVFFFSTREIYGKMEEDCQYISENSMGIVECYEERACYPESKRIAESICKAYEKEYNINSNVIRIAHVYGPRMNIKNDGRIMSDIFQCIIEKRNILLKSDGNAKRAFCYLSDAIRGICYIVLYGKANEVYNLSNENEELTINDLAKLIIAESKEKINIEHCIIESKVYTNYKRVGLDNRKLNNLGWKPKINLVNGIRKTLDFFSEE